MTLNDIIDDITSKLSKQIAERDEQFRRQAIRETDWEETAVLRIIERHPEIQVKEWSEQYEQKFTVELPEYEVKRYRERAPPATEHADGKRRYSVQTVTKPLLDEVSKEYPGIFEEFL